MPGLCSLKLPSIMPQALLSLEGGFRCCPGTPLRLPWEAEGTPAGASEMPLCRDLGRLCCGSAPLPATPGMAEPLCLNCQRSVSVTWPSICFEVCRASPRPG